MTLQSPKYVKITAFSLKKVEHQNVKVFTEPQFWSEHFFIGNYLYSQSNFLWDGFCILVYTDELAWNPFHLSGAKEKPRDKSK